MDPGGYRDQWEVVPDNGDFPNGFRAQWELFLTHLYTDVPFPHDLLSGVRGLQLAEAGLQSAKTGRTVELEEVSLP